MSKVLTSHKVNACNDQIRIEALGDPTNNGAYSDYRLALSDESLSFILNFQLGDPSKVGVNGFTHEALLAILIDRLEGFQVGFPRCEYQNQALSHLKQARAYLNKRTQDRLERGVEGTNQA